MRYNWQDFSATKAEHIVNALASNELVRLIHFGHSIEKHGQIIMKVQLFNVHLPDKLPSCAVLHLNREIIAFVKLFKLSILEDFDLIRRLERARFWRCHRFSFLVERA